MSLIDGAVVCFVALFVDLATVIYKRVNDVSGEGLKGSTISLLFCLYTIKNTRSIY